MRNNIVLFFWFDGYFLKALSLSRKKSPKVREEKMINRFYVLGKQWMCNHIGPNVAVIDTVKRIQLDRVRLEVSWQKCC